MSAEAVLISALLNTGSVTTALNYGVAPDHFRGYKNEYAWLLNHVEIYGQEPSWDLFLQAFPAFKGDRCGETNVRAAVDMVWKTENSWRLRQAMNESFDLLAAGDVREAHKNLRMDLLSTAPPPRDLLTDMSFLDTWDERHSFIEVPYRTLQMATGGIRPGNLWYLAARPGQGKSGHLCNMATKALLEGCRVMFYSLEMSEQEVRYRFHSKLANHWGYQGITLTGLRDRTVERDVYKSFIEELEEKLDATGGRLDIHTPRDGMITPSTIAARAGEYHLNVVDYHGLMKNDQGQAAVTDWRIAAEISNNLKLIASASNSAFLAAAQINREGASGKTPPSLSQLAQSDALGQDGDVVLTFRAMAHNVATWFLLDKNRHGPGGLQFFTNFNQNVGDFTEISKAEAEERELEMEDVA